MIIIISSSSNSSSSDGIVVVVVVEYRCKVHMVCFLTELSTDLVPGIKLSYLLKLFMSRLRPNETDNVDQFLKKW